jgi:hypothetical protein
MLALSPATITQHLISPNSPNTQEDYRRWVELVYAGDVHDFHGVRLRRYVFSQEDFRNDSAMAPDFYHDNLPTCVTSFVYIYVCLSAAVDLTPNNIPIHKSTAA